MHNMELLAEILGWAGVFFLILSPQAKSGRSIILTQGIGNVFVTAHYFFNGAMSGAITAGIATIRNFLGVYLSGAWLKYTIIACIISPYLFIYLTANSFSGYIAATAAAIISLGVIYKEKSQIVRYSNFIATLLWLTFAVLVGSAPMATSNCIVLISIITGIIRHEEVFAPLRAKLTLNTQTA